MKEIKGLQIGKEETKEYLYADEMIVHKSVLKCSPGRLLQRINLFFPVAVYKINSQISCSPI